MIPDGCNNPDCLQGRLGHCNTHTHKPRKPKPLYGVNHHHHTQNTSSSVLPGGYGMANMCQGVPGNMTPSYASGRAPVMSQGGPGSMSGPGNMAVPMAPSYSSHAVPSGLAPGKVPSVAEEAEGPGIGPLDDTEQDCAGAARRLTQVMHWMRDNNHTGAMLRDFAHSDSCNVPACSPFCRMFRRVRRHVQGAQHPCMLLRTYAVLLRLHVQSCTAEECGLRACPTLRNRHLVQNIDNQQQILPDQQEDMDMPEH